MAELKVRSEIAGSVWKLEVAVGDAVGGAMAPAQAQYYGYPSYGGYGGYCNPYYSPYGGCGYGYPYAYGYGYPYYPAAWWGGGWGWGGGRFGGFRGGFHGGGFHGGG